MSTTKRPREKGPESLTGMTLDEFRERVSAAGLQEYRAKQVFEWVYVHRAAEYQEMTNLPKTLRAELDRELPVFTSSVDREQVSSDGTVKLLVRLHDGETVETVMIPDGERRTVCLSTQAGCAVGCSFCASGLLGLQRNLTTGEIVEQVLHVRRAIPTDERVSNLVFMGMGEPLANYRIIYRTDPSRIVILTVRHGHQQLPRKDLEDS